MNKSMEEQRNNKKRYIIISIVSLLVLIVLLLFIFVIYPNINKSKSFTPSNREVSITDITGSTSLRSDNSLVFSYEDEESVTFTSTSAGVYIGSYPNPTYIYSARDSSINEVSITYSNNRVNISNLTFRVTISDDNGLNQRLLKEDEYLVNNSTFTYSSSLSIYIYNVVIEYLY